MLSCLLAGGSTGAWAADRPGVPAADEFVRRQSAAAGVPGVAYAVVGRDGVRQQAAFGVDGDGRAVDQRTPFLWGSVSKPVTATLVALLVRDGVLGLDTPVAELVPAFRTADPASARRITVRQLLDHTSGLPEGLDLTDRYGDDRRIAPVLAQLAERDPVAPPGARHSYSSLNYVVLGAVIEAVTGRPFGQALSERLLRPAGMDPAVGDAARTVPPGHRFVLGRARSFATRIDPVTVPAGYLAGSIDDLAAYARTQLDGGPVLDDRERARLHTATTTTGEGQGYGLGWRTSRLPGSDEPVVWHAGAAPGYQSAVVLLPERGLAVVVLQNVYGPFHDAKLLDTAWGVASLTTGATPQQRNGTDPTYFALLGVLGLVALILLVFVIGSVAGLFRAPKRRRAVGLAVLLVVLAALVAGLLILPRLLGISLEQLGLWAPDVAWLVCAALGLSVALAVLRVVATWRGSAAVRRGQPT